MPDRQMGKVNVRVFQVGTRLGRQGRDASGILSIISAGLILLTSGLAAGAKPPAHSGAARKPAAVKASVQKEAPAKETPAGESTDKDLARQLDQALMPAGLKATFGACVLEVPSGRVIYEKNADQPLAPASNMKLDYHGHGPGQARQHV